MKPKITLGNIVSFIDGNVKNLVNKTLGLPSHILEQYYYRLYLCKDTCLVKGNCKKCGCPVMLKAFAQKSCNPDLHLDLMPGADWKLFKEENNIDDAIFEEIKNLINERR